MEHPIKGLLIISLATTLLGCAIEPSQRAQRIIPAYPEMVSNCALLGGVTGIAPVLAMPIGEQYAKYQALDEAAQLGATHIVWTDTTAGIVPLDNFRATAQGRAYYCDPDRAMPQPYRYMEQYLRLHRYPYDGLQD
jgi:hypothetical protein